MSDLFGNHIVGFPMRWLNYTVQFSSTGSHDLAFFPVDIKLRNEHPYKHMPDFVFIVRQLSLLNTPLSVIYDCPVLLLKPVSPSSND